MKRTIVVFVACVIFFYGQSGSYAEIPEIADLAEKISQDYANQEKQILFKKHLAILQFSNNSRVMKEYNVGGIVAAMLSDEMVNSTIFTLVERNKVNVLLKEVELGMTGAISQQSAVKAGKLTGAELLMIGSVSELADSIVINAKLVVTSTGRVISSRRIEVPKSDLISQSKVLYLTSFQSKYGISVGITTGMLISAEDYDGEFNVLSVDAAYRALKYFRFGIGYTYISGNEVIRNNISHTFNSTNYDNIWRNYNVDVHGPKLLAEFVYPFFRWLNGCIRFEYIIGVNNSVTQDLADFPTWEITGVDQTAVVRRRILVNSFANESNIPHIFALLAKVEFLISKRVSLFLACGLTYSTDLTPEVYEAAGRRQWFETIDENGTFSEYDNFNFARDEDGNRVKFNFTGYLVNAGLAIHF